MKTSNYIEINKINKKSTLYKLNYNLKIRSICREAVVKIQTVIN